MKRPRIRHAAVDVQPDMNVTPLVDVVLVLLIIFMVVAPRMDQDVPVDLPGIFNVDPDVKASVDPLKITVAKGGAYHIDGKEYDLQGATELLSAEHVADPYRRVVLRADAKLTFGDVRQLFAKVQDIGFPGLSLMVGERHRSQSSSDDSAQPSNQAY
ncbi:MAG: biopolymer transporter ExbD [Deltaproteobacteria bacterium]|nr:biopolymer transporter ExbD [Deltaproteobacteria bacterium]